MNSDRMGGGMKGLHFFAVIWSLALSLTAMEDQSFYERMVISFHDNGTAYEGHLMGFLLPMGWKNRLLY